MTPWTPAQMTTALWLDADDASTITLNGSTVSQWNDKSGNNRHVIQPTAAWQPTYAPSGLNGRPSLAFDGGPPSPTTSDYLSFPSGFLNAVPAFSLVMVMQGPEQTNNAVFGPQETGQRGLELIYTALVDWPTLVRINNVNRVTSGLWSTNNTPSLSFLTSTASATAGWLNGSTVFSTAGNAPLNFNGTYALGRYYAGYHAAMNVSEFIITTNDLSTAARQKLEGYLAWKWGLVASLPVDHPYKSTAPTTSIDSKMYYYRQMKNRSII